jgi:hypothetical protein
MNKSIIREDFSDNKNTLDLPVASTLTAVANEDISKIHFKKNSEKEALLMELLVSTSSTTIFIALPAPFALTVLTLATVTPVTASLEISIIFHLVLKIELTGPIGRLLARQ